MNDTCRALLERRTIRRFKPVPIAAEDMDLIARCGAMAASAGNRQPWEFILVLAPDLVDKVTDTLRWLGGTPPPQGRPAAHVVILVRHPDPKWTVHADAGAAAQNMLVAAWSLGLGTCWAGSVNHRRLRALLDIPEIDDLHIFSVVSFGVPDESPVVEVAPSDPPRAYRDEGGVLHVEKRPLAEVIHVDGYRPRRQPVE